jgi:ribosomal protein L21E
MALLSSLAFITYIAVSPAKAQIMKPFIEGDEVYIEPSSVRCMPHKEFRALVNSKAMRIVISGSTAEGVMRVIWDNNNRDVLVSNIFPNDKACVLEIIEGATFSKEFFFPKTEEAPTE